MLFHGIDFFSNPTLKGVLRLIVLDGISIFFVLSGFLIGHILIKTVNTKPINISTLLNFWKRRWFRTLPNYLLILITIYTISDNNGLSELIKYLLFLQNFNTPHPFFFPEAWSLSVEEWFYFLIPIGLFFTLRIGLQRKQGIMFMIILIVLASILIRYYKFYSMEFESALTWHYTFRMQVVTRMDSIMFGIFGAYLNYYHRNLWLKYKNWCLLSGIALLVLHKYSFFISKNGISSSYYCIYSFLVSSTGTLLLLPFLSNYKKKREYCIRVLL